MRLTTTAAMPASTALASGDDRRTGYSVTYFKRPNSPQLLARRIADKDDPRVPFSVSEFLARAWKAANDKARELGWIV